MERSSIDFSKTRLIVFELRPYPLNDGFVSQVSKLLERPEYEAKFKGNVSVVDFVSILQKEDFYLLDVHITKKGNDKIVQALLDSAGL